MDQIEKFGHMFSWTSEFKKKIDLVHCVKMNGEGRAPTLSLILQNVSEWCHNNYLDNYNWVLQQNSSNQCYNNTVCGKPQERASPILVTLTSCSDSNFERSNITLKENKRDGVNLNSNGVDYCVRKNDGRILWFSAD